MTRAVSIATVGACVAALSQLTSRNLITRWTGINAPGGIWRLLAILFALANFKNLPFVWHLRFFKAYWYQIFIQPTPIPPQALFQPVITSTHAPLTEIDFNMHKSNSTYFADMDISRTHLFTIIVRNGIRKVSKNGMHMPRASNKAQNPAATAGLGATEGTSTKKADETYMIALGGVMCNFKKEILPYQKFEMWTRILSWDRKWFYLVTHLVKPGVGKPASFSLQPWRKGKRDPGEDIDAEKLKGAVFATAVARYVIKRGRLTIPPEKALFDADMVPAKPEGWVYSGDEGGMNGHANGDVDGVLPEKVAGDAVEWNWDVIERERRRGLRFAEAYTQFDELIEVWDGGKEGVLGEFPDLLWR